MRPERRKLEPTGQLEPQAWMQAPETQIVVAALTAEGGEIRFVGGCVRDSVLKRPVKDVDIATRDRPERVMELLTQAGLLALPTGLKHGTVTAVVGKTRFEITTLREDVESFGRQARVSFTDDWLVDAARRDFTMNAMSADLEGRVYDPFNGLSDLGARQISFVGEPKERIQEDVLRLLRYFRFLAHYESNAIDVAALAACRKFAPDLVHLSGERVAGEILRLLMAPDPATILTLMHGNDILESILPEALEFGQLRILSWLETRAIVRPTLGADPIRRLGALLRTDYEGAIAVGKRLKLSALQTERLAAIAAPRAEMASTLPDAALRRLLRQIGASEARDILLKAWARERSLSLKNIAREDTQRWIGRLDLIDAWEPVTLPVRGRDCLEMGVPPGPDVGRMLAQVDQWWEERDYQPGREDCLKILRTNAPLR